MQLQFLNVIQVVLSVILVLVVLLQVRGQGGGLFGSSDGSYRTRVGFEKILFQFTIVLIVVFIFTSIVSVRCVAGLFPCG